MYVNSIATNTKREDRKKKQRNETNGKSRKARQVNRLLRKERRKQNYRGEKTCLYTSFIITQQFKDDSCSDSFFECESVMETNSNKQNDLKSRLSLFVS